MDKMQRVDDWLEFLRSRGRKASTLTAYRDVMSRITETAESLRMSTEPEDVDEEEIFLMMDGLSNLKEGTLRYYMTIWGYYIDWATGHNPVHDAKILWNHSEPDRVFITMDELVRMYEAADPADRLILCLGAFMGLRRMEIQTLTYDDIADGRMTIHGKGHGPNGKVATLKIPRPVLRALDEYRPYREALMDGREDRSEGRVLVHRGVGKTIVPYSLTDLSTAVRSLGQSVGVRAQTHSLRRLFATTLHDSGLDITDIKTLMRHEDVGTTIRCYIQPNRERLDAVMDGLDMDCAVLNI